MPVCPKCKSYKLHQQANTRIFKCGNCGAKFKLEEINAS